MQTLETLRQILGEVLQLDDRVDQLDAHSPLLGAIPEFDSMAVVNVIGAIEDQFAIEIDDDDISAEAFETLGSLVDFVQSKRQCR
jgi:acyl carrier protein